MKVEEEEGGGRWRKVEEGGVFNVSKGESFLMFDCLIVRLFDCLIV